MTILSGIPVLNCQSIEKSLQFYQQILHFVIVNKRDDNGELCWVHLMHGETTLMLQSIGASLSQQQGGQFAHTISLYFFVDNIDDLKHLISAKGMSSSAMKVMDYNMREFSLSDPDGNIIVIAEKS